MNGGAGLPALLAWIAAFGVGLVATGAFGLYLLRGKPPARPTADQLRQLQVLAEIEHREDFSADLS